MRQDWRREGLGPADPEAGRFHVMDRAYPDFTRLNAIHMMGAFFVTRAKSNTKFRRRYSRPVDKSTGLPCDQTVLIMGVKTKDNYPSPCGARSTGTRKPAGRSTS